MARFSPPKTETGQQTPRNRMEPFIPMIIPRRRGKREAALWIKMPLADIFHDPPRRAAES
jgi:hypothetical protein